MGLLDERLLGRSIGTAEAPQGEFDASLSVSPTTIERGEGFSISATVENVGSVAATDEFVIEWDGTNLCTHFGIGSLLDNPCFVTPGEVAPGETFTMSVSVAGGDTGDVPTGDHSITVVQNPTSGGASPTLASRTITVETAPGEPEFDPADVSVTSCDVSPDPVDRNDLATFTATVRNSNDAAAECDVNWEFGIARFSLTHVVVDANDSRTVASDFPVDVAGNTYDLDANVDDVGRA